MHLGVVIVSSCDVCLSCSNSERKFLEDLEVIDVVTSPRGHFGDVERCLFTNCANVKARGKGCHCNADCAAYTYLLDGFGQSPL